MRQFVLGREREQLIMFRPGPSAAETIEQAIGRTVCSDWFQVTQDQIDAFSAATGDRQWIHQADAHAGESPFGGAIAHGLLLVSLAIQLARDCGGLPDDTWVLYGFNRLRFSAPVRSGARIRSSSTIQGVRELSGRIVVDLRFVVEIENQKLPAVVADCLLLRLLAGASPK